MVAYLIVVRYRREQRVLYDGHYLDRRRQPRPEQRLQQRVYSGREEQRLHHPRSPCLPADAALHDLNKEATHIR